MSGASLSWDQRHARLLERIDREREALGYLIGRVQAPVRRVEHVGERTRDIVHRLSFLGIPLVTLMLLRPRRALRWVARIWGVYRLVNRTRRLIHI